MEPRARPIARRLRSAAVAAAVAVATGAAAQQPDSVLRLLRYQYVLDLYARGDRAVAVHEIGSFSWEDLDLVWHTIEGKAKAQVLCPTCSDPLFERLLLKAAVMLHADRDVAERPANVVVEQPPSCSGRHARRAAQLAGLLASRPDSRDFARRFHLAMAQRAQWDACLEETVDWWGRDGLALFANDPELLLTVGAALEKHAQLTDRSPTPLLRDALRYLGPAVAAEPTRVLARVHLGRVQWRLGQHDEARATLEAAVEQAGPAEDLYLAHLCLGQVHERAGRADAAVEAFRTALDIDPDGQAAAVALAHVHLLRGETTAARQAVDRALAAPRDHFDPHWNYLAGNAKGVQALLDELREETLR